MEGVTKSYDGVKVAVDAVDLHIQDGSFTVIVGPSGCGKTTLLNMIAGLDHPSSGRICFDGRDVHGTEPRERNVAMVFQTCALYPHLSVRDNLAFPLKVRRVKEEIARVKIERVAALLDISDLLKRKPDQLSGGQKQRVAIGKAIIREPSVFLMDEPLSNLDAGLRATMRQELRNLHHKMGTTFVYVTHDRTEAMTLATSLVVMNQGSIQQIGTPYQVFFRPGNLFVAGFMGTHPLNLFSCRVNKTLDTIEVKVLGGCFCFPGKSRGIPENILVGVRPEGFEVSVRGIRASVLSTEILGGDTLVRCLVEGNGQQELLVLLPTETAVELRGPVTLCPKAGGIMLFHPDTGNRIPGTEEGTFRY